jgi:hypothetical protein
LITTGQQQTNGGYPGSVMIHTVSFLSGLTPGYWRALKQMGSIYGTTGESIRANWPDEVALALMQCIVFLYFTATRHSASKNDLYEVNFCLLSFVIKWSL